MADRFTLMNDAEAAVTYALDGRQSKMWTALPGIVIGVNWTQMTLQVQPAIQGVYTNQEGAQSYVNLPPLVDVPIVFPSAGGFALTLPIGAGDEVLVILASRCIDAWWQSGGIGVPLELRMHDLSDGFAIPGPRSVPKVIKELSHTNAQLRSDDGSVMLELTPNGACNIVAPAGVTITGNLTVTGTIGATEEITGKTSGTAIPLSTHIHPGVTSGGADTGAPIP